MQDRLQIVSLCVLWALGLKCRPSSTFRSIHFDGNRPTVRHVLIKHGFVHFAFPHCNLHLVKIRQRVAIRMTWGEGECKGIVLEFIGFLECSCKSRLSCFFIVKRRKLVRAALHSIREEIVALKEAMGYECTEMATLARRGHDFVELEGPYKSQFSILFLNVLWYVKMKSGKNSADEGACLAGRFKCIEIHSGNKSQFLLETAGRRDTENIISNEGEVRSVNDSI